MKRTILALLISLAACRPGEFWGEEGNIGFTSNLIHEYDSWYPSVAIAVDTHFQFRAIASNLVDEIGDSIPPSVTPSLSDDTLVENIVILRNNISAEAVMPGRFDIEWIGVPDDHFTVHISNPSDIALIDPIENREVAFHVENYINPNWASPSQTIVLFRGSDNIFDFALYDDSNEKLCSNPDRLYCRSIGRTNLSILNDGYSCVIALGPQEQVLGVQQIEAAYSDLVTRRYDVRSVDVREVANIALSQNSDYYGITVFTASATTSDGDKIWGAPIVWEYDTKYFRRWGYHDLTATVDTRNDVHLLQWVYNIEGPYDTSVIVRIGSLSDEIRFTGFNYGYYSNTETIEKKTANCNSAGGYPSLMLIVLALLRCLTTRLT